MNENETRTQKPEWGNAPLHYNDGTPAAAPAPVLTTVGVSSGMSVFLFILGALQILAGIIVALIVGTPESGYVWTETGAAIHLTRAWLIFLSNLMAALFWFVLAVVIGHLHAIRYLLQSRPLAQS